MNNNEPRTIRRAALALGVIAVAAAAYVLGQASAPDVTAGPPAPTSSPAPPPQAIRPVGQECLGTTPEPGSSPAHPICDWSKIFAADRARADELRQQQRTQIEERANELRRPDGGGH